MADYWAPGITPGKESGYDAPDPARVQHILKKFAGLPVMHIECNWDDECHIGIRCSACGEMYTVWEESDWGDSGKAWGRPDLCCSCAAKEK